MDRSIIASIWILAAVLGCEPSERASPMADEAASPTPTDAIVQLEKVSPTADEAGSLGETRSVAQSEKASVTADEIDSSVQARVPSSPEPSMASLTDTRWVLQTLSGKPAGPGAGGKAANITLEGSESRATGFAGCNQFNGGYIVGAGELSFGNMAMTKRLCSEGMGLERDFSRVLTVTRSYRIDGNTLSLVDQNGTVVAVFEAG